MARGETKRNSKEGERDQDAADPASLRAEVRRLREEIGNLAPGIDDFLKRRGFRVHKKEPSDDLLLPEPEHRDGYYGMLHKYSFRLFLRDVIKHRKLFTLDQVARYASPRAATGYIDFLLSLGLIRQNPDGYSLGTSTIKSFGATLEWYLAELLRREFAAETTWGVKFKRPAVGGDYDVLARFETILLYCEVKSSPPKQIYDREVTAFLDRVDDLGPEIAVFLMDTELRMKDKIVPLFEAALRARSGDPPPVERMERELFQIRDRVYIINAKESLLQNMERVISRFFKQRASMLR